MIDDILYKVMYKNNFEEIIILRDTIILEYLLQRRNSDYKISKYLSELIEQLKTYKLDISYGYGYTSILYMCNLVNIDGIVYDGWREPLCSLYESHHQTAS